MIVILVALKEELEKKDLPDVSRLHIVHTGVGKINAAIHTMDAIYRFSPSLIINYGTAGCFNNDLNGLVEIKRFVQRDVDATALGFAPGETPFDSMKTIDLGKGGYSCGTGDSHVTHRAHIQTDLVDMEAYAIAKICSLKGISFQCYKYISDHADMHAKKDWFDHVSMGKSHFLDRLQDFLSVQAP